MEIKKETKVVFGNAVLISPDRPVAFLLDISSEGNVRENYGVQTFFLEATFMSDNSFSIKKKIKLATGTDGHGSVEPYKKELFGILYKNGLSELIRKNVSLLLLRRYLEGGEVTTDEAIEAIDLLLLKVG